MHNIIMQVVDHQEKIIKFYNMPKEKKNDIKYEQMKNLILNLYKCKTSRF